jgi:hypothetical protein
MAVRFAVERALAFSLSAEGGEERQACDAAVSISKKGEETSSPEMPAVHILHVSTHASLPVAPERTATPRLPLDKVNLPTKMVPRRHEPSVVIYTSTASRLCLPISKTARMQSKSMDDPSEVMEGEWLARAATYI